VDELREWLIKAACSELSEFRRFAKGLTVEWSQGQVEGQMHRLKMIKRQMYGRAKPDLLRARVLHAN
jgi:transposase